VVERNGESVTNVDKWDRWNPEERCALVREMMRLFVGNGSTTPTPENFTPSVGLEEEISEAAALNYSDMLETLREYLEPVLEG
jgi:hypothetical protein